MALLYELRLILTNGEKKEYTTEEIIELLDKTVGKLLIKKGVMYNE